MNSRQMALIREFIDITHNLRSSVTVTNPLVELVVSRRTTNTEEMQNECFPLLQSVLFAWTLGTELLSSTATAFDRRERSGQFLHATALSCKRPSKDQRHRIHFNNARLCCLHSARPQHSPRYSHNIFALCDDGKLFCL
jgi:hypothetical protein